MNLKSESELGDIYISFIYRTISFYRGLSQGTLVPLTLKTSLNTNLANIFTSTRITCHSSLTNL